MLDDDIVPEVGEYVLLDSGGTGQVMDTGRAGSYLVRLTGTETEQLTTKSQIRKVLTVKSQKRE